VLGVTAMIPAGSEDPFVAHRSLLFTVAYEMLGAVTDAEDVVQEAWLRWARIDQAEVRNPRAFLVQIVTRKALDRMRAVARQRDEYVGEWLPEPLLTAPDVADDVVLADSVSVAMLTVLETLTDIERVVFVLREVFAVPFAEIATAVDKSPAAVRQIAHRARSRVTARRPRTKVGAFEHRQVVERFRAAIGGGELEAFLELLAPDVDLVSDGGGLVPAARRPIHGREPVAAFLSAGSRRWTGVPMTYQWINGALAVRIDEGGPWDTALAVEVEDGRIGRIFVLRNPQKIAKLNLPATLTRD
jgi:RNA polymerase sigma-70 factor (TIGR02957 family)